MVGLTPLEPPNKRPSGAGQPTERAALRPLMPCWMDLDFCAVVSLACVASVNVGGVGRGRRRRPRRWPGPSSAPLPLHHHQDPPPDQAPLPQPTLRLSRQRVGRISGFVTSDGRLAVPRPASLSPEPPPRPGTAACSWRAARPGRRLPHRRRLRMTWRAIKATITTTAAIATYSEYRVTGCRSC